MFRRTLLTLASLLIWLGGVSPGARAQGTEQVVFDNLTHTAVIAAHEKTATPDDLQKQNVNARLEVV